MKCRRYTFHLSEGEQRLEMGFLTLIVYSSHQFAAAAFLPHPFLPVSRLMKNYILPLFQVKVLFKLLIFLLKVWILINWPF